MDKLAYILNNFASFTKSYRIPKISSNFIRKFPIQEDYITEGLTCNPFFKSFQSSHKDIATNVDLYEPINYYCRKKAIDESELSKQGNFNRSVLTDIRTMKHKKGYLPKKDILLRICLVLQLNHDETLEILNLAGYTLSEEYPADMIISYAITEKYYDITNIDDAIFRTTGKYYLQPKKAKDKDEDS